MCFLLPACRCGGIAAEAGCQEDDCQKRCLASAPTSALVSYILLHTIEPRPPPPKRPQHEPLPCSKVQAKAEQSCPSVMLIPVWVQVAAAVMLCFGHKSPSVRCKAAMHLDACVQGPNGQRLAGQSALFFQVKQPSHETELIHCSSRRGVSASQSITRLAQVPLRCQRASHAPYARCSVSSMSQPHGSHAPRRSLQTLSSLAQGSLAWWLAPSKQRWS